MLMLVAGCSFEKTTARPAHYPTGCPPGSDLLPKKTNLRKPMKTCHGPTMVWTNTGLHSRKPTKLRKNGIFLDNLITKKMIVHSCYQRVPCTNNGFSTKSNLVPKTIDACVSDVTLIHFGWLLNPHVWCWGQSLLAQFHGWWLNFLSLTAEFHENSISYRSSTIYTKNDLLLLLVKKYNF